MRLIYMYGISIFTVLIWFKLITLGIIVYYINSYKKNEFYYYQSLGLSKLFLWISTILIDLSLFVISIITMLQIK
jgi:type III secretory pathway component EscU